MDYRQKKEKVKRILDYLELLENSNLNQQERIREFKAEFNLSAKSYYRYIKRKKSGYYKPPKDKIRMINMGRVIIK